MARKKSQQVLNIYLNQLLVGALEYRNKERLTFQYKEEWLTRPNPFPISRSLPLREEPYEGQSVYAYFDNLLPDNVSTRQRIATRMRAESDQVFDLLAVVGRDCVGALQFVNDDEDPPLGGAPIGTPVSDSKIAAMLRNLRAAPLAASEEEDFRLSIAGAQEKTALLFHDGKWQVPLDATPTTHIFKPQIGELKPGMSFSDSVENEWLCAQIVQAFGLEVAKCTIEQFEDLHVLVVERFDRDWVGRRLIRVPQEDLCQALSFPNFGKYEAEGGPGIVKIMGILNESTYRDKDRHNFMKTQVVFLLLAAIDGHGKNFSIRWSPTGFSLTPLYDVLSAQPLTDQGKLQSEKIKMAMAVGDSRHWRVREILTRHFLQTAKACRFDIKHMGQIIDETRSQIDAVIASVSASLPPGFPAETAESIFAGMKKRADQIKELRPG